VPSAAAEAHRILPQPTTAYRAAYADWGAAWNREFSCQMEAK
jgi:hypothetical protein